MKKRKQTVPLTEARDRDLCAVAGVRPTKELLEAIRGKPLAQAVRTVHRAKAGLFPALPRTAGQQARRLLGE